MDKQKRFNEIAKIMMNVYHNDCSSKTNCEIIKNGDSVSCDVCIFAEALISANFGNVRALGESIIAVLDDEMNSLKRCQENLKKEENYRMAEIMEVRYYEIDKVKSKVLSVVKEYVGND